MSIITVNDYDTFADWKTKTNSLATAVGDLALLQTSSNSSIVTAINEIKGGNIESINVTGTRYSIDLNGVRYVNITDTASIDFAGNVNTTGDFTAGGFGSIGGRLDVGGLLTVVGATQINNTLVVTSGTTLQTTLAVGGSTTIGGTLNVTGTITGTITKCSRSITPDTTSGLSYLIGGGDLTTDRTFRVDASTAATADKVVARDSTGDIYMVNSRVAGNLYLTAGTSQIIQTDDGAEAANAGSGEGRLEYSVSRWMIKAGSDSARIVDFKRGGSVVSYIATDGVYNGTATAARYADLAEKYTTDKEYPVGTVMVVSMGGDSECTQSFMPSQLAIGVISENPAFMMNSEADGQYIALKGRVPVRVVGPVLKGQSLVATADGRAMYGQLNPIGCALETNMEPGEKLIEVAII
jgi:hypothetical protein